MAFISVLFSLFCQKIPLTAYTLLIQFRLVGDISRLIESFEDEKNGRIGDGEEVVALFSDSLDDVIDIVPILGYHRQYDGFAESFQHFGNDIAHII